MPRAIRPAKVTLQNAQSVAFVDLDYIRMTSCSGADLLSYAEWLRDELFAREQFKKTPYGFNSGPLTYYRNKGLCKVDIAGEVASEAFQMVLDFAAQQNGADGSSWEFTRVDYAIDIRLDEPVPTLAKDWYAAVGERAILSREGDTLYLGSRKSGNFGRIYDKSVRYGDAMGSGTVWRFELEAKRVQARRLAAVWQKAGDKGWHIASVVAYQMKKWGVGLPLSGVRVQQELAVKQEGNTMRWLRHTVAPSIARLVSAGREDEVLSALGLSEVMNNRVRQEVLLG